MKDTIPYEYDRVMQTRERAYKIPYIKFPSKREIKICPPFSGATIRFCVKKGEKEVSIYLDCYDNLGLRGKPYWEIYPYGEDTFRCDMEDTKSLLDAIKKSLSE